MIIPLVGSIVIADPTFTSLIADMIPLTTIFPFVFVILACVSSCDIFKSLSVPKLATALSANFAANVVAFVPRTTPLVSTLPNVPTPVAFKSGTSIPLIVVVSF